MRGRAQQKMHDNVKRWRRQAPELRERLLRARAHVKELCTVHPPAQGQWPKIDEKVIEAFKARRDAGDMVRSALPRARTRRASRGAGGASQITRAWVQSRARNIAKALPAGDVVDFQASASWFRRCGSFAFWTPTH